MKVYAFIFFLVVTRLCQAQADGEASIRGLLDEQTRSWNRGDIDGFMKTYWKSDSLMFVGKSGITYGWENTRDNYKKSYPNADAMGILSFNIIAVQRLSPEYFNVVGKWHLKRTIGDLSGHFTLILKLIRGQWMIVSDHSS